ncbi:hypothetical protein LA080_011816 [Diaporthe eres]|nr:hypothetical protein LA080_011816 [Diaporthe eres]
MEDTERARRHVNWIIQKCKKGIKIQKSIERNRSKSALDHLFSKQGDLVSDVWKTAQMREHRLAWAVKQLPHRVRECIAELLPEKLKSLYQSDDSWRKLVQVWETKRKRQGESMLHWPRPTQHRPTKLYNDHPPNKPNPQDSTCSSTKPSDKPTKTEDGFWESYNRCRELTSTMREKFGMDLPQNEEQLLKHTSR